MRILQINANYGFGSTGVIVKDISEMLIREGEESYCAFQKSSETIENGYRIGNPIDWKLHAVLCRLLGNQGYYSTLATKKFIAYLDDIKPDIVHLHNLHSNYINIDILFSYLSNRDVATVITMHDCWYFTGKCFHYADCDCDRFIYECGECKKQHAPPNSVFFDQSAWSIRNKRQRLSAIPRLQIVGCSEWICREARKGFLRNNDIDCIYNGVDTTVFKPTTSSIRSEYGIPYNNFLIMGMANKWMLPSNIDIIDRFLRTEDVSIIIVGCTEEQKKKLKQYGKMVVPVGFIKDCNKMASFYSSADVFVNLTHADTLPTVNMESICCGTPVVTYDSCGSPELVCPKTGIIVKENDKDKIVEAVNTVRNMTYEDCSKIGSKIFDKNKCYVKYLEIYHQLLSENK